MKEKKLECVKFVYEEDDEYPDISFTIFEEPNIDGDYDRHVYLSKKEAKSFAKFVDSIFKKKG